MRKGMKKVLSLLLAVVLLPALLLPPSAAWAGGGDAHEHAWAGVFAADSEYHWRMCMADSECDIRNPREMMDFGPHVYDSSGNMRSMNDIMMDLNASMDGMTAEQKQNIISTISGATKVTGLPGKAMAALTGRVGIVLKLMPVFEAVWQRNDHPDYLQRRGSDKRYRERHHPGLVGAGVYQPGWRTAAE